MIIVICIFIVADIVLLAALARNMYERDMMKKYGQVKQAEVRCWKQIPGRPTRYAIKVCYGYDMAGNEKTKWKVTSGKFGKKYERERKIDIVFMPDFEHFYLKENNWKVDNAVTVSMIVFDTFLLIVTLLVFLASI